MSTLSNKELARQFYESVFNDRNLLLFDELAAPELVDHNPDPGQAPGREGTKAMFRGMFEAFPDMRMEVAAMVADGDIVGTEINVTGTHRGAFAGVEPTGRTVTVRGFDWIRFRGGKAVERWGAFDMAGMMAQIGVMPGPSPDELKAMSKKYYERLTATKGDLAGLREEYLHPQHAFQFGCQSRPMDIDGMQQLLKTFWTAFPDLVQNVEAQICEGNTVFNRLRVTGTHRGEFAGVAATNRGCSITVMTAQVYAHGKIVEQRVQPDMISLLAQIGAIKP